MRPDQYKASPLNVIRGQRYEPTLTPAGLILRKEEQLIRAEDPSRTVNLWQVTLSPVFQRAIGQDFQGIPARQNPVTGAGLYQVEMTWGGGGVGFRTRYSYPASGASFAVAGDNIMLQAFSLDIVNVYTEDNKPCFVVWVAPTAQPSSPRPITEVVNAGRNPIPPWARALTVTKDTLGATVLVEFSFGAGAFVAFAQLQGTDSELSVPIPSGAIEVRLTASAGNPVGYLDLVFT